MRSIQVLAVDRRRDGFPFGNREHFDFGVFACFGLAEVNWLFELVVLHSCCLDLRGESSSGFSNDSRDDASIRMLPM